MCAKASLSFVASDHLHREMIAGEFSYFGTDSLKPTEDYPDNLKTFFCISRDQIPENKSLPLYFTTEHN